MRAANDLTSLWEEALRAWNDEISPEHAWVSRVLPKIPGACRNTVLSSGSPDECARWAQWLEANRARIIRKRWGSWLDWHFSWAEWWISAAASLLHSPDRSLCSLPELPRDLDLNNYPADLRAMAEYLSRHDCPLASPANERTPDLFFPLVIEPQGRVRTYLARFGLTRMPHGAGRVFLHPESLLPLGHAFRGVISDAQHALPSLIAQPADPCDICIRIHMVEGDDEVLRDYGVDGRSSGGALLLSLAWLHTADTSSPLRRPIAASFAFDSERGLTQEVRHYDKKVARIVDWNKAHPEEERISLFLAAQENQPEDFTFETNLTALGRTHIKDHLETVRIWSSDNESEPDLPECPYKGLLAFREEDQHLFFGRERAAAELFNRVVSKELTLVLGPSGCGKSSLIYAGLVPNLRRSGDWVIVAFRPGGRPFRSLASALLPVLDPELSETARLLETRILENALADGSVKLEDVASRIIDRHSARRLLLVVDQFEEFYTQSEDKNDRRFIDALLQFVNSSSQRADILRLVLTMRADFLGYALEYGPFAAAIQDADLKLGPMSRSELKEAIERPAALLSVTFEDGLVDRILDAVHQDRGNLPLVEFALSLLWERQHDLRLTHAAYDQIGGIEQALATYADEVYLAFDEDHRAQIQQVFIQMVRPGEGTDNYRCPATRAAIGEERWPQVQRLADARLVVTGRDDAAGTEIAEIAHEALIRGWKRLRDWMDANRRFRRWQERLKAMMPEDTAADLSRGTLLRGLQLAEASAWLEQRPEALSRHQTSFIRASVRQERREHHQRRALSVTAALAATVFIVLAFVAAAQWRNARVVQSQILADRARLALTQRNYLDAEMLFAKALTISDDRETREGLIEAQAKAPRLILSTPGLGGKTEIAFRPDRSLYAFTTVGSRVLMTCLHGKPDSRTFTLQSGIECAAWNTGASRIAAADDAGTVAVWDASSGRTQNTLRVNQVSRGAKVTCLAFVQSDRRLAVGLDNNDILIYDLTNSKMPFKPLRGHQDRVQSVSGSRDGRWLVSTSWDKCVLLWDLTTGRLKRTLYKHSDAVIDGIFHPDGVHVITSGSDRTVRAGSISSSANEPVKQPLDATIREDWKREKPLVTDDIVESIRTSADGQTLVLGDNVGNAKLYDWVSGFVIRVRCFTNDVRRVALSADGNEFAVADADGSVKLFDRREKKLARVYIGHKELIAGVAFSPRQPLLATGSQDNTVRLWNTNTGYFAGFLRDKNGKSAAGNVLFLAFDPDGSRLATGSDDGKVRVYDVPAKREIWTSKPSNPPVAVWSVAFRPPDGAMLVSADTSGGVRFWDSRTGQEVPTQAAHPVSTGSRVLSMAFSPDGRQMASGDRAGDIRLWDLDHPNGPIAVGRQRNGIWGVAFSPDGKRLASGCADGTIAIWDVAARRLLRELPRGHIGEVWSIAFAADGSLVSGGVDSTVRLWNIETGQQMQVLRGEESGVWSVAFSPAGDAVASGGADRSAHVWNLNTVKALMSASPESLLRQAGENTGLEFHGLDIVPRPLARSSK